MRLDSGESGERVWDDFPDAELFRVEAINSTEVDEEFANLWLIEMISFFSTGLPPKGMSLDERKWLAVQSQNFCLLEDILYHKGTDRILWQGVR